jgi:hypothetical protein
MRGTQKREVTNHTLLISETELREFLHCGRACAVKIGNAAGARVQIGKRVLWNLPKIRDYVESISE